MTASYNVTSYDLDRFAAGHLSVMEGTLTVGGAGTYAKGLVLARSTATQKWVPFVSGGASGAGTPSAILVEEVVASGAGDITVSAVVEGVIYKDKLVAGSTLTNVELDMLRSFGIMAVASEDISEI